MTERVVSISGKTVTVASPGDSSSSEIPLATLTTPGLMLKGSAVPDVGSAYLEADVLYALIKSLRDAKIISS